MSSLIEQITSTKLPDKAPAKVDSATPELKIVTEDQLLAPPAPPAPAETPAPAAAETPAPGTAETPIISPGEDATTTAANPTAAAPTQATAPGENTETRRGRGRPAGSKNRPRADFSDVANQVARVDYSKMSGALFDASTGMLTNTFGPEWQPRAPEERQMVVDSLAAYLHSKQVQDIPPGVMLCFVLAAYCGPRLAVPTTANKVKPAVAWCWEKIKGFFRRKPPIISVIPGAPKSN